MTKQYLKKLFGYTKSFVHYDKSTDKTKIQKLLQQNKAQIANKGDFVDEGSLIDSVVLVPVQDGNIKYNARLYVINDIVVKLTTL